MLSFKNFMTVLKNSPAQLNRPSPYLFKHSIRLYETYKAAFEVVKNGDDLLSVGAGRAFVEYALSRELDLNVTIFDFPETVERNKDQYSENQFTLCGGNIVTDLPRLSGKNFDLILYCEIIEHIPIDPARQFEELIKYLKPGGRLILTTPNICSLPKIAKLLSGQNIIPSAERLFSNVAEENEAVHRREYVLAEICDGMKNKEIRVNYGRHILQSLPQMQSASFMGSVLHVGAQIIMYIVPLWRPMILVVGQRL